MRRINRYRIWVVVLGFLSLLSLTGAFLEGDEASFWLIFAVLFGFVALMVHVVDAFRN